MILKTVTADAKETYLSVLESYKKMQRDFLEYAVLFGDYSDVYNILSESTLYKRRKTYEVAVNGQSFFFEAPLWFEKSKLDLLRHYKIVGDQFNSIYLHIVWNRDAKYFVDNHKIEIKNPPNIGELIVDIWNGENPEFNSKLTEDIMLYVGKMPTNSNEFLNALKKLERHYNMESKRNPRKYVNPVTEGLKQSFSARDVKTLTQLSKYEMQLARTVGSETTGYIEILGSLDDLHQIEWMLNQKITLLSGEPLDVIMSRDKEHRPFPWNRKFLERIIENYHFRLNQVFSILEGKSRSVLSNLDYVERNALSTSAESDLLEFLDFVKNQKTVLAENRMRETELIELYFSLHKSN